MNIFKQRGNYDPSLMLSSLMMSIGLLIILLPLAQDEVKIKKDVVYDAVMDGRGGNAKY